MYFALFSFPFQDVGDLFLFDSRRFSQLYLPSGKTKKKIPLLQSYLEEVQVFGISPSGKESPILLPLK